MTRHRILAKPLFPALVLMAFAFASTAVVAETATADRSAVLQTRMALRDLWVEHVFWIRSYVLASHAHDPLQEKAAEQEVVANARALAATIQPFYGQAASDGLFQLLAGHWDAVRSYNQATLAKSHDAQQKATARIVSNAHEIARFLAGANPYLPEDTVFGLLSSHGGHHIAQIDGIAARDFRGEAANWHAMRQHMLVISDAIVDALARQFPQKFQRTA
jgi:hypothetical protein